MRTVVLLIVGLVAWVVAPAASLAGALFSDGYLGLTQEELRAKLGTPHKIRDKSAALRVYKYYAFDEWENVLKDQIPGAVGEDVYLYVRDKTHVRYSFQYAKEERPDSDTPTLIVKLVDIEFLSPDPITGAVEGPVAVPLAVPLKEVPKLIPEFKPSLADDAPTYRSNLFIIMLQNETSKGALRLVKERNKEDYTWSLSYRLYATEPFPPRITLNEIVNRVEIAIDSLQLIKDHYKLTHEAMINPFSAKAASLPPPAESPKKTIPRPRYAP
ncbi:MAG TPA: hypothetical protein VE201_04715 [Nitrospirales bacterium]|nr:hypothetical protein [Nitrospirales bacterium]